MKTSTFKESRIILIFALVFGFSYMNRLAVNYVFPVIQNDLNISGADIGFIIFVSNLTMAISAIVIGFISDKQGKRKKFLTMSVITIGIGSMLSVIADSYTTFLLARALVGIGFGPVTAMLFSITEKVSSENKLGANTGFTMAGGEFLATIIAPFVITQLAVMLHWQMALFLIGIPTIFVGIIVAKYVPDVTEFVEEEESDCDAIEEVIVKPLEIFKYDNIITCFLLATLTLGGFFSLIIYAPLYFEESMKLDLATIGMIASGMGIVSIGYTFIVPRSTDKFGRKPVLVLASLVCALAPLSIYLFSGSYIAMGGFILFGGLAGSMIPFFINIVPIEGLPDNLKGSGCAILLAAGELLGTGVMVYLAGILADLYGYSNLMLFSGALFVASFFIGFFLKESNMAVVSQELDSIEEVDDTEEPLSA